MRKVIIASCNPIKFQSVKNAFLKMFPKDAFGFEAIKVDSGVGDQPMTDEATLKGALVRAEKIKELRRDADFWIGIEGGVEKRDGQMGCFAWAVALNGGRMGKARSAMFLLPPRIMELIDKGYELSKADDIVFNRENSKHQNGAVGLLTGDIITRTDYYEHAMLLALIPFKNKDLY